MSVSTLHVVRFSPDPEAGEWLNLAVFGTNHEERLVMVVFGSAFARIHRAFGEAAADRARRTSQDLRRFAANAQKEMTEDPAHIRYISDAIKDQALSLRVSGEYTCFEGTLHDAMAEAEAKYLGGQTLETSDDGSFTLAPNILRIIESSEIVRSVAGSSNASQRHDTAFCEKGWHLGHDEKGERYYFRRVGHGGTLIYVFCSHPEVLDTRLVVCSPNEGPWLCEACDTFIATEGQRTQGNAPPQEQPISHGALKFGGGGES